MSNENDLIGYARVSTEEQNLDLQIDALVRAGVPEDRIFTEKISGVAVKRPQRALAVKSCRPGCKFVVWKLDRVGRSLLDLLRFMEDLDKREIKFVSLQDGIDTSTPVGRVMLAMLGAFAQFERDLIAERTRAGVKRAQERGVKFGQPTKLTAKVRKEFEQRVKAGESVKAIAKSMKIAESTFRKEYRRPDLDALRRKRK